MEEAFEGTREPAVDKWSRSLRTAATTNTSSHSNVDRDFYIGISFHSLLVGSTNASATNVISAMAF
jgi:hypothetical protein